MDFEVYGEKPIFYNMKLMKCWLLNPDIDTNVFQIISKHFISLKDSWYPNHETYYGEFFKFSSLIDRFYNTGKFPGEIFRASTYLFEEATYHEREAYNLIDLVGELGGVIEFFIVAAGILIYPISK